MPLVLSRALVERLLPLEECIELMHETQIAFSAGRAIMPLRLTAAFHEAGLLRAMPAWLDEGPSLGMKAITNFPGNAARGLPPILATMLVFDAATGALLALIDGVHLTNVRTAAVSAAATRALARPGSSTLALVGAGVQAAGHLAAMAAVLPLERVSVAARSRASAERFVVEQAPRHPHLLLSAVDSPARALAEADVVCTVSSAREPVVVAGSLRPGAHVNAVGSHAPAARELDGETMAAARVVVDSREAALRECGDCMLPIAAGLFGPEHVADELGEVLAGTKPGRRDAEQVTVFQSCGLAVQDLAAAKMVLDRARAAGLGIEIEL